MDLQFFAIDDGDAVIFYVPLKQALVRVPKIHAPGWRDAVNFTPSGSYSPAPPSLAPLVDKFDPANLSDSPRPSNSPNLTNSTSSINLANPIGVLNPIDLSNIALHSALLQFFTTITQMKEPARRNADHLEQATYTGLTFFPTSRCNLRCQYCYARGGETPQDLSLPMAYDAVRYILRQLPVGVKNFNLNFHGGGEPTQNFSFMHEITAFTLAECDRLHLKCQIGLTSNGCFSEKIQDWIQANVTNLTISIDGPPPIQNSQRPCADGTASATLVEKNIIALASKKKIALRATITPDTLSRMPEIYEYLARFPVELIHFEPVTLSGRASQNYSSTAIDPAIFATQYITLLERSLQTGIPIVISGADLFHLKNHFCGACHNSFALTPDGFVSSCYEQTRHIPGCESPFLIGQYDAPSHTFALFPDRIATLRQRTVTNMEPCRSCFIKWSCAGGCPYHGYSATGSLLGHDSVKCQINRSVSLYILRALSHGRSISTGKERIVPFLATPRDLEPEPPFHAYIISG